MSDRRHRISLRFVAPETEKYFVQSQSENILRNSFVLTLVSIMLNAAILTLIPFDEGPTAGDHRVTMSKQLAMVANITGILLSMMICIFTRVPRLNKCVRCEFLEVMAVAVMMFFTITPFLMSSFYSPAILGYNPQEVWGSERRFSDTRQILALSALTTASHLTMPIRWIVLLPFEVFTIVTYAAFAFILGGPDGMGAWSTLALYAGLVLCSAIGRRTIENHQRDALLQLIKERRLRAETEFKLTQLEQKGPLPAPAHSKEEDQLTTGRDSRPETTPSAHAFVNAAREGDLQSIIEIGKSENWFIDPKELDLNHDQVLGQGGYGKVVTGWFAGAKAAVKIMPEVSSRLQKCDDQPLLASILHEIRVIRRLRHPGIVSFYGACFDNEAGTASLVIEWVHGPCLERFILQGGVPNRPLIAADQLKAISDTCWAVCYLHSRRPSIVHGDLKGTNIIMEKDPLCSNSFRAKLLDFGLSRVLTQHVGRMGGTAMWVAPEVLRGEPAHWNADTFSFGRLSFFILTGIFPFGHVQKARIFKLLQSGSLPPLPWPIASSSNRMVEEWRWWIEACSDANPLERPRMQDVANFIMETSKEADSSSQDPEEHPTSRKFPAATSEGAGADQEPVAELVLDILQEGLLIKESSHGFTLRFGHVAAKSRLADLLESIDEWESWIQTSINHLLYQQPSPNLRTTLNMPQGPVKAACRVAPQSGTQEFEEARAAFDMTDVHIQFFKIDSSKATMDSKGTPVNHLSL